MKQEDIEDAIDSVATFAKIWVRRAIQETDRAATVVSERFYKPAPANEEDPALWTVTLGSVRTAQASGVDYRVLAFSRMAGNQALMRVGFSDGSTGEYPLQHVLSDPVVSSGEFSSNSR